MNDIRIAREMVAVARRLAGDEWADEQTFAFTEDVAKVMRRTRGVRIVSVKMNVICFLHSPDVFGPAVSLTLTLKEFGHGGVSENVNGIITTPSHAGFRIPGGHTRTRDPKELWDRGLKNLMDIVNRAQGRTARTNYGYEAWKALENARNNLSMAMTKLQVLVDREAPDNSNEIERMVSTLEQMSFQVGTMRSQAYAL